MLILVIFFGLIAAVLALTSLKLLHYLQKKQRQLQDAELNAANSQHALKQLQQQCQSALEDSVTGLTGWTLFEDRFQHVIVESERSKMIVGLLLIEVSDFAMVDNVVGDKGSQILLKEVATRIKQALRKVDTVSRYKNATFCVMATQLAKPETAAIVAQRILQTLAQPFYIQNQILYINVCVGISTFPEDGSDFTTLVQMAQSAAKTAGENGNHVYHFYREKSQSSSQRELTIHVNIKRDEMLQELKVYYQPILNTQVRSVCCMDVLLHWFHPQLGNVGPEELYHHIEKQRAANRFTEWLLKTACRQFVKWHQFGFKPAHLAVPISIRQLENKPFIYHMQQIMSEAGFKPEWLLLILKDTGIEIPFIELESSFNMLDYMGVRLAMSGVGSMAFSFAYLRQIKADYLILEQSFIADIQDNEQTQLVVKGLSEFALSINSQLVARGVETATQAALLRDAGCYFMQGPYAGEALEEGDVKVKMSPQV